MDLIGVLQLEHVVPGDLLVLGAVIVLSCLLSCDNAVVMALLVRELPREQRSKALRYGIIGAYVFRIAALVLATWIMGIWYLKIAGGAYLLYLAIDHFVRPKAKDTRARRPRLFGLSAFWSTVVAVEIADVAFSVDSIAASIALSDKLWILILGSLIGIVVMRFAAQLVVLLLERYPRLEAAAFVAIGVIGLQLLLEFPVDVVRSPRPLPDGTAYASVDEYRRAVEATIDRRHGLGNVVVVTTTAPVPPSQAIIHAELLRREPTRPGAEASPAAQERLERQSRRAFDEATSYWNLHFRPFLDMKSWLSSLLVLGVFAFGFIRPSPTNGKAGSAQ